MSAPGYRDLLREGLRHGLRAVLVLGLGLGCPARSTTAPAGRPGSGHDADSDADSEAPTTSDPAPNTEPALDPEPDERPPPLSTGPDASELAAHPCEYSCAEVHDCVARVEPGGAPAAAALELGCLAACVAAPPARQRPLFGCASPAALDAPACASYLACVDAGWPSAGAAPAPAPADPVPPGRGCERACAVFARCNNPDTEAENIHRCILRCEEVLSAEQEQALGACTTLPGCEEIERCILDTPGA